MRLFLVHNRYIHPGGEDTVFTAEKTLLERMGHKVFTFEEDNARLRKLHPVKAALNAIWSREAQKKLRALIREIQPEVCHFHNTFLMISPAAYYACKEARIPVVQTLHNYRLICPGALLMRDGRVCEDCLGRAVPWLGMVHGCWRGARLQTAVAVGMLTFHRALKTWSKKVDRYIALTEFARSKFIEGGLPAEKIVVKPNFVHPDPALGEHRDNFALFVGRLSPEKGVRTLLQAWRHLKGIPLKVLGDGPLRTEMERFVEEKNLQTVEMLGRRSREGVFRLMHEARILVFPSECYENFPMAVAEAFATGLPVIASRLGAMAELVEHGRTGLLFDPGNPEALAEAVAWAWGHPQQMAEMGHAARQEYESKYTAERNYEQLMAIYRSVVSA